VILPVVCTRPEADALTVRTICAAAVLIAGCGSAAPSQVPLEQSPWISRERAGITVQADAQDSARLGEWLTVAEAGRARIQEFFGRTVDGGFTITVFPTRAAINAHWQDTFGAPNVQFPCWMVASATRAGVTMLSPRVWASEQCGHDGGNAQETAMIVAHEIAHVLHARTSSHREINVLMSFKWYNEGIANLAAGMYTDTAGLAASAASVSSLAAVIDLSNGYQVARSMAAFIDARYGRARNADLLRRASTAEVLSDLGLSESQFIEQWRAWCCQSVR